MTQVHTGCPQKKFIIKSSGNLLVNFKSVIYEFFIVLQSQLKRLKKFKRTFLNFLKLGILTNLQKKEIK